MSVSVNTVDRALEIFGVSSSNPAAAEIFRHQFVKCWCPYLQRIRKIKKMQRKTYKKCGLRAFSGFDIQEKGLKILKKHVFIILKTHQKIKLQTKKMFVLKSSFWYSRISFVMFCTL